MNRRSAIQLLTAFAGAPLPSAGAQVLAARQDSPSIVRPQDFGAKADGATLDSPAINRAIDQVAGAGGGIVYLSPGVYLSGTVILKSNVTLYIEAGAVLLGSRDVAQYTPQAGPEPTADANQRHLIFAKDAENVTVAGPGLVDGQGPSFWYPSGRVPLPVAAQWQDVATRDWKVKARVSPMLEFVNCRHLRVEQLRIQNASGWTMRLMSCDLVVVDGVSIKNVIYGPNVDGIDISNSSNVRIANCSIDTADDAICLKSENPYGSTIPTLRNVTVTNCLLTGCCNGFKIGTRGYAGFENIVFSNSVIHNTAESELKARVISGICLEMVDGGWVEGVVVNGIRMQRTRTPIFIRLGARTKPADRRQSYLRGVMIADIHATEGVLASSITGLPGREVEDVTLSNLHLESREEGARETNSREIPEVAAEYPEARMFGRLPVYGLYARHVRGLRVRDTVFQKQPAEQRPAVLCDDVRSLELSNLQSSRSFSGSPLIRLHNTQNAWVRDSQAHLSSPALAEVSGAGSEDILISACDLRSAATAVLLSPEVPRSAVKLSGNIERSA